MEHIINFTQICICGLVTYNFVLWLTPLQKSAARLQRIQITRFSFLWILRPPFHWCCSWSCSPSSLAASASSPPSSRFAPTARSGSWRRGRGCHRERCEKTKTVKRKKENVKWDTFPTLIVCPARDRPRAAWAPRTRLSDWAVHYTSKEYFISVLRETDPSVFCQILNYGWEHLRVLRSINKVSSQHAAQGVPKIHASDKDGCSKSSSKKKKKKYVAYLIIVQSNHSWIKWYRGEGQVTGRQYRSRESALGRRFLRCFAILYEDRRLLRRLPKPQYARRTPSNSTQRTSDFFFESCFLVIWVVTNLSTFRSQRCLNSMIRWVPNYRYVQHGNTSFSHY